MSLLQELLDRSDNPDTPFLVGGDQSLSLRTLAETPAPCAGIAPGEVVALIGDVLMEQTVLMHCLLIIFGTGLHPVKPPLNSDQLFLGFLQPSGGIGHVAVIAHIEMAHGVFQTQGGLWGWSDRLRRFHFAFIENVAKIFAGLGFFHCNPPQTPPRLRPAGELGLDDSRLGHADAVLGGVDGGA